MSLDNQERMGVSLTQLAQQPLCGLVVEMAKRDPPRPRQCRALNDAVVDQCIVNDQVIAVEQMANDRHVRRVTANQHDTILAAMDLGQGPLELSVYGALA